MRPKYSSFFELNVHEKAKTVRETIKLSARSRFQVELLIRSLHPSPRLESGLVANRFVNAGRTLSEWGGASPGEDCGKRLRVTIRDKWNLTRSRKFEQDS